MIFIILFLGVVNFLLEALMMAYFFRHYVFTLVVSRRATKIPEDVADDRYQPFVSILVPARDEENVIGLLLHRMTELSYPRNKLQLIIIDDASSDKTGQIAEDLSRQYTFMKVLHRDKTIGGKGKPSALNHGLKHAIGEIVILFDADYYPQREIVEKLVKKFIDPLVCAVQGRPVVRNEGQNIVTRLASLERIGGNRADQEARDILRVIPQFGGTVGAFRRSFVEEQGGFDESMLTEDTDLTFQIYVAGFKVRYYGDAECYEEAVDNWRAYWKQRHRWAQGHMQVCFKYAFKVLRSKKLTLREKIDGILLLHVYFMPVLTLISFLISAFLILSQSSHIFYALWLFVPMSVYGLAGNLAPFFEIGIGAYLDGRTRLQFLVPLLLFAYLLNTLICTKALLDLFAAKLFRRNHIGWNKTYHFGDGNRYIGN